MTRTIIRERLPHFVQFAQTPSGVCTMAGGRHVHHDSESWRYRLDTSGLKVAAVRHERRIPVLDQGQLGSCTGNAGIGALGTDPLYATVPSRVRPLLVAGQGGVYSLDEAGAVQLYSDATKVDSYPGQYPPTDTGSDGLTVAKVLQKAGLIAGYQHTFTLSDALRAITAYPLMVGSVWYNSMFSPNAEGLLTVDAASGVAGGHEYVVDEYDPVRGWVGMTNSWGTGWGAAGRAYIEAEAFGRLLDQQGDVIVLLPLTQPAPTPTPDADHALAAVARPWVARHHTSIAGNATMQAALRTWLHEKGL